MRIRDGIALVVLVPALLCAAPARADGLSLRMLRFRTGGVVVVSYAGRIEDVRHAGRIYTLRETIAVSGVRYSDGPVTRHEKGDTGTLNRENPWRPLATDRRAQ